MADELLPCPFCGNPHVEMLGPDAVWCGSCLAQMPPHDPDVPNARARWNTRLSTDAEVLRGAFIAGWWVNAADPTDGDAYGPQGQAYFEGCAEADWQHYLATLSPTIDSADGGGEA